MFTGIIEAMSRVKQVAKAGGNTRLCIDLGPLAESVKLGDSIAINGVCLTITYLEDSLAVFEAMAETLGKSNLGELREGEMVNVERSVRPIDGLGGHLVMGHVDGVGTIADREDAEGSSEICVQAPHEITGLLVVKGSVALDGISLTLVDVEKGRFTVCLTPYTLRHTTLGRKTVGDKVNIEVDIIGRYVKEFVREMG